MLHFKTIDSGTLGILKYLMQVQEFNQLYLVGGTALALQIGHRKSIDIDLFGNFTFDSYKLSELLNRFKNVTLLHSSQNIKTYLIDNIKVDFVNYPYAWIENRIHSDDLRMAGKKDIAAMKLAAVTGRGTKKDFIDIFWLFNYFSLEEMLVFYRKKYPDGSDFLVLKSLTYFKDAELEESPVLLKKTDWDKVKDKITSETMDFINSR